MAIPGSDGALPPPSRAQQAWQRFCRLTARIFYRRCETSGLENLPATGPVILCANHVNALADALVVQATCPRPIHPLARSGLFRKPLLRPLLRAIQAVPVSRRQPGDAELNDEERAERNRAAFARCYEYLAEGRVLLIFPEGQSHSDPRLRELKTGAARLALGAEEGGGATPAVVPVGLTFTHKGRFRSSVLVTYGEPVRAEEAAGESGEERVRALHARLGEGLEKVTLNLDSWEDLTLLRLLQSFFDLRRERHPKRDLELRFRSYQRLLATYRRLRFAHPERTALLRQKLRRFERLRRRYGVESYHLELRYTPALVAGFVARALFFALLVFPLALWGLLNSGVPYLLTRQASRWSARGRDQYDSASMLFGLLFFVPFWGAQSFAVWWTWGLWPALAYAASLPLAAGIALKVGWERRRILENVRVFLLFLRKKQVRAFLQTKRQELEVDLAEAARLAAGLATERAPE